MFTAIKTPAYPSNSAPRMIRPIAIYFVVLEFSETVSVSAVVGVGVTLGSDSDVEGVSSSLLSSLISTGSSPTTGAGSSPSFVYIIDTSSINISELPFVSK